MFWVLQTWSRFITSTSEPALCVVTMQTSDYYLHRGSVEKIRETVRIPWDRPVPSDLCHVSERLLHADNPANRTRRFLIASTLYDSHLSAVHYGCTSETASPEITDSPSCARVAWERVDSVKYHVQNKLWREECTGICNSHLPNWSWCLSVTDAILLLQSKSHCK
jgi:hypothetical protein